MMGWMVWMLLSTPPYVEALFEVDSVVVQWDGQTLHWTAHLHALKNVQTSFRGNLVLSPSSQTAAWTAISPSTKTAAVSPSGQAVTFSFRYTGVVDTTDTLRLTLVLRMTSLDPVGPDTLARGVLTRHLLIRGDSLWFLDEFPDSLQGQVFSAVEVEEGSGTQVYGKVVFANHDYDPPVLEPLSQLEVTVCDVWGVDCQTVYTDDQGTFPVVKYTDTGNNHAFYVIISTENDAAYIKNDDDPWGGAQVFYQGGVAAPPGATVVFQVGPPEWGKAISTMQKIWKFSTQHFAYHPPRHIRIWVKGGNS